MDETNEILTTREVAARLKLTYQTVMRMVRNGIIPATKITTIWRVQSKDLYAWLDANKRVVPGDKEGGP